MAHTPSTHARRHNNFTRRRRDSDFTRRRRDNGFTLLEVIAALAVLGMILAGLAQLLHFGQASLAASTRLSERGAQYTRVDRALRLVLEYAAPPLAADDKPMAGQQHRMIFTSLLPRQPPTALIRRAQIALGVDEHHRLVLRWQPHPNADPLEVVHSDITEQTIILLENVDHLDISYRQGIADGGAWKTEWTDVQLPALVRLHIALLAPGRPWPDLLIAPRLDSIGSF
jgi:general secretion pathway protein J